MFGLLVPSAYLCIKTKTMRYLVFLFLLAACSAPTAETETVTPDEPASPYGWQYAPTIDDFGDTTSAKGALIGLFPGTFSNSATVKDTLIAKVQVFEDSMIFISLFEYGNIPVTFPRSLEFPLDVKAEGSIYTLPVSMGKEFIVDMEKLLYNILDQSSGKVAIRADLSQANEYLNSEYVFAVDADGLREIRE